MFCVAFLLGDDSAVHASLQVREELKPIEARSYSRSGSLVSEVSSPPSHGSPPTCAFSALNADFGNHYSVGMMGF